MNESRFRHCKNEVLRIVASTKNTQKRNEVGDGVASITIEVWIIVRVDLANGQERKQEKEGKNSVHSSISEF